MTLVHPDLLPLEGFTEFITAFTVNIFDVGDIIAKPKFLS